MGWGISKKHRCEVLSDFGASASDVYDCTVVDMCSETRRVGSGSHEQSSVTLARRICESLWRRTAVNGVLVMLFDDSTYTHPERRLFYTQRYKPASEQKIAAAHADSSKVVVGGFVHAAGMAPYTAAEIKNMTMFSKVNFNRLWSSGLGKAAAWVFLADACVHWHCSHGKPDEHRLVCWHKGAPMIWPCGDAAVRNMASEMCSNTFGEADQRVCEAAVVAAKTMSVRIQTIDTDMVLQCLCTSAFGGAGKICLQLKNECINVRAMRSGLRSRTAKTAGKKTSLVSTAFWLMACGGVDYCRGLTRFGYTTNLLLSNMKHPVVSCSGGKLVVDTPALLRTLGGTRRRKVKTACWKELVHEVNKMAFCLALFAGMGKQRMGYGGPDVPAVTWLTKEGALTDHGVRAASAIAMPVVVDDF